MILNKYTEDPSGGNTSALRYTGWHVSHEKGSSKLPQSPLADSYNHTGADRYRKTGY